MQGAQREYSDMPFGRSTESAGAFFSLLYFQKYPKIITGGACPSRDFML